jgi:nucleoside-diphosphate-sugar epimerase
MKHILITGANSYIGTSLEKWLNKNHEQYPIDTLDMQSEDWKEKDFSKYDVIFHVAGIAHIKETKKNQELYYKVNRDLAYKTAQKAKVSGVKQFIFLSSMSVYGIEEGSIDENTLLNPNNNYGKSKLQAEELIRPLNDNSFKIAIIRPPMVYGKGCKGNYPKLSRMVLNLPVFPKIESKRSMIYIDNLCEFVRFLIDDGAHGLFFPQNKEYVNISDMVSLIAKVHGKKIWTTKLFNSLLKLLNIDIVNKAFGDLVYLLELSNYHNFQYCVVDLEKSIPLCEKRSNSELLDKI